MSLQILVVEDSPTMRQLIVMALKRIPEVAIDEAGDGVEGLKKIKQNQYQLIITDINMPLMDGLKLLSLVRQDEKHQKVPVLIVTTESAEEDRNRAFALGATAYITKPVQAPRLLQKVQELLEQV